MCMQIHFTADVICNVYVFLGRISDIFKSLSGCVCCALSTQVMLTDPTKNIAYFFMYVIIQELLNMNVLVSEIDLNIQ